MMASTPFLSSYLHICLLGNWFRLTVSSEFALIRQLYHLRAPVCLSFSGLRQRPGLSSSSDILLNCGNGFKTVQIMMCDAWLESRNVYTDNGLPVQL